jgi:hypothetical protein
MTPSIFIGTLLQSRDAMHLAHWKSESLSEHKALNEYYEKILELTDSFVEKYFGRNGRITIVAPEAKAEKPTTHLKGLRATIEEERVHYTSDLQNIMDEMIGLINETIYLLTLV